MDWMRCGGCVVTWCGGCEEYCVCLLELEGEVSVEV